MTCPTCGARVEFPLDDCLFCQLWGSCVEACLSKDSGLLVEVLGLNNESIEDIDTIVRRELKAIANDQSNLQTRTVDSRRGRKIGFNV